METTSSMGEGMWIILLVILLFGGGTFGANTDTTIANNEILSGQKFDAIARQINQVGDGLCSSTYALNNTIQSEGRNLQTQMATDTASINATTVAQTQKILDSISENKIADLTSKVNSLELANAMSGVVRYPNGWTYNAGTSPFCSCNCSSSI